MAPLGQLFGVSLETVLENEASGFLIPLLVKLCIQVAIIITVVMAMVVMLMVMKTRILLITKLTQRRCSGDREERSRHNRALPAVRVRDKEKNAPRGV